MPALSSLSDPSIYQNIKQTDALDQIGALTDVSRRNLALQKERELYAPSVAQAKATSETAVTQAEGAKAKLQKDYFGIAADEANALVNDPRLAKINPADHKSITAAGDALVSATDRMVKQGVPAPLAYTLTSKYFQMLNDPNQVGNIRQDMLNSIQARIGAQGQQGLQTPQYTTNAAGEIIGLKAGSNQIVSPSEVGGAVAPAGSPVAPAGGAVGQMNNQFAPKRSLNPSRADVGFSTTPVEIASKDLADTISLAKGAEPRIAIFQNIKKLAPESFTSTGGARKELLSGIAQAVGIDAYTLEKTATDELAKNSAMLTLAGGNTDMARQIAEAANPNKKMTEGAIKLMADQLIGVERMNQAKAKYLGDVTNPQEYQKKMNVFNQINDSRIFQESNPEEVKKLKASMSPDEQRRMGEKIKLAKSLGLI
jgi:hypothetical protein